MLYLIYSTYVDSLIFLRKNILIAGFFFLNSVINIGVNSLFKDYGILRSAFGFCLFLLLPVFINVYIIALVYKANNLIDSDETPWMIVKRFYERAFLLNILSGLVFALVCMPPFFILVFIAEQFRLIWYILFATLFLFFYFGSYLIGTRWMIFHDEHFFKSIKGGLKEFWNGFSFYTLVVLIGLVFSFYSSLIVPSNWLVFPFFPIVENAFISSNSLLRIIFNSIITAWLSIALTYSFLSNHKKFGV
jgi:hypothetical protein